MVPALCGPPLPAISSSRPEGSSGYFHCNIQHFHSQPSLKPEPMSTTKKSNFPLEPPSCPVPGAAGWAGHYQPRQTPDPVLSHTFPPTSCSIQAGPHPHDSPHSPQPPPKAAPEERAAASVPFPQALQPCHTSACTMQDPLASNAMGWTALQVPGSRLAMPKAALQ